MLARYAGASLGLLAFTIVVTAGLIARYPVTVTPSRSIFALFLFCLIGLVLGRMPNWWWPNTNTNGIRRFINGTTGCRRQSPVTDRKTGLSTKRVGR